MANTDGSCASDARKKEAIDPDRLSLKEWLWVHLAASSVGFVTGFLTGQAGSNPSIVSSVLPAVVTVAGGALLTYRGFHQNSTGKPHIILISAIIFIFSFFLYVGFNFGTFVEEKSSREADNVAREAYRRNLEVDMRTLVLKRDYLFECSKAESYLNARRELLGLPPILPEIFCPSALEARPWHLIIDQDKQHKDLGSKDDPQPSYP